jgi:hypothetical protein
LIDIALLQYYCGHINAFLHFYSFSGISRTALITVIFWRFPTIGQRAIAAPVTSVSAVELQQERILASRTSLRFTRA